VDRIPKIRFLPVPKYRIRWLTRDEADRLLEELPEHLAEMVRFTLATGLRASNVKGLKWSQVDLARRVAWIHADEIKDGVALNVPLNNEAVLVVRRQLGVHRSSVFTYQGKPVVQLNGQAWRKALDRAGIRPYEGRDAGITYPTRKEYKYADFRWHDLRHTWASWHRGLPHPRSSPHMRGLAGASRRTTFRDSRLTGPQYDLDDGEIRSSGARKYQERGKRTRRYRSRFSHAKENDSEYRP